MCVSPNKAGFGTSPGEKKAAGQAALDLGQAAPGSDQLLQVALGL